MTGRPPGRCAHCNVMRRRESLVVVEHVATGERRFVCRPRMGRGCFTTSVGNRDIDRLVVVDDEPGIREPNGGESIGEGHTTAGGPRP